MRMKKILTLLLIMVAFVGQTNAWNNVYLFYKGNSYSGTGNEFTRVNDNSFYYIVPRNDSYCDGNDFFFRINVLGGSDWFQYGPSINDTEITLDGITQGRDDTRSENAYKIPYNGSSNYYRINFNYDSTNEEWVISVTYSESFNITYIDAANWNWEGGVHFYTFQGAFSTCGAWPGTTITQVDGQYSATVEGFADGKVSINDNGGNKHEKDLVNNGVYHSHFVKIEGVDVGSIDLYAVKANISSAGYATFSSTKALDFTSESTIQACKASVAAGGNITYTAVTSVAANEGVLLRRADGTIASASSIIPLHANQSVAANESNDFVGITFKQKLAQKADEKTNYILTIHTSTGDGPLGFYKVNHGGSWCAAGTAYLSTSASPGSARDYFPLWDDVAPVESIVKGVENTNLPVYDLQGRCVANPQKGLYIVNGKKVVIK